MKSENFSVLVVGILLLFIGLVIKYISGKRRFKRRTVGGMQAFESYNKSLMIPFIEGLLSILSFLMILGGIGLIFLNYLNYR